MIIFLIFFRHQEFFWWQFFGSRNFSWQFLASGIFLWESYWLQKIFCKNLKLRNFSPQEFNLDFISFFRMHVRLRRFTLPTQQAFAESLAQFFFLFWSETSYRSSWCQTAKISLTFVIKLKQIRGVNPEVNEMKILG